MNWKGWQKAGCAEYAAKAILAAALACALASGLFAEGGKPGEIFNFGAGARPLAMGGAYTALTNDAASVYYNPAGLGMLNGRNLSLMHAGLFEGMSYEYLGYAQNFGGLPGGWGAQVLRLSAGSAPGRDEFNLPAPDFSYSETAFSVAAGMHGVFLPRLSAGAGLKIVSRAMDSSSDRLLGLDIGLQYGPLLDGRLSFGFSAQNAGAFSSGDTSDRLPLAMKAGVSYLLAPGLALAVDASDSGQLRAGTEYVMGPGALRLGYDRQAVSFGAGVKFMKAYQLDVAMLRHETLGLSNRVSLNYYFGGLSKPSRARAYSVDYIVKAGHSIAARDYVKALENVEMAAGLDINLYKGGWGERRRRLSAAVKGLKLAELPERQAALMASGEQPEEAGRAMYEYIYGNNIKSALLAHSALGYEKNNAFYGDFLSLVLNLTSFELRKDEILPRPLLKREKLNKAAALFYERRFESALRQCEEILLLDDKDALAWTRLGSAYYAMGDREKARKAYERGLQLDPSDLSTLDFMKMQGWK
ncbi:MAG TPA: hypothetical protein DCS63_01855 [Elusimicrobia bacterium]|nr:hypothetical protein [Elusimicrobiota bacterium]